MSHVPLFVSENAFFEEKEGEEGGGGERREGGRGRRGEGEGDDYN